MADEEPKAPPASTDVLALEQCSLWVEIWIDPSNLKKWFEAMKPAFEKVSAEPECLYFEIFQDPDDPGHLTWVENWNASPMWLLTVQIPKDYYKPYYEATEPMFIKPRQFKLLRRLGAPWVAQKDGNLNKVGDFHEALLQ